MYETSLDRTRHRQLPLAGFLEATAVAVDWVANNLYVVDKIGDRIDVVSIDSGVQTNILNYLLKPVDVDLDPGHG